jgi:hypothetical protein
MGHASGAKARLSGLFNVAAKAATHKDSQKCKGSQKQEVYQE